MTKLKFILSCLTILSMAGVVPASNTMVSHEQELRSEIASLVNRLDFEEFDIEEDQRIVITFLVNRDNQIVILNTNNQQFDQYFKEKLNYRTLRHSSSKPNQIYTVPITLML